MTEREVVVVALAMAVAAAAAIAVPLWCVVAGAVGALALRHPMAVAVAAVMLTSMLAHRAESGLGDGARGRIEGWATLVSDPDRSWSGGRAEVSIDDHRYVASFPDRTPGLDEALTGDAFLVRGVVRDVDAPFGYRAARHLAGRLNVIEVSGRRPATGPLGVANGVRRSMESSLGSFSPDDAALFTGIVYGDDRAQSEVTVYRFRRSGLAHLMAVSGQNVGFVLLVAAPVLMRIDLRGRLWLSAALVGLFVAVTRAEPSVLRAAAMIMVVAYAAWRGRYTTALRVLAVAVSALLIVDPLMIWSLGFQLSVAASAALILMVAPLMGTAGARRWWHVPLAASVAAQAGTAPLLVGVAGSVPLAGPLTNVVAVPLAGAVMAYGVCAAPLAGLLGEPFATWVGWPSRGLLGVLDALATLGSASWLPMLGMAGAAAVSVATVGAVVSQGRMRRGIMVVSAVVVCLDLTLGMPQGRVDSSGAAQVWVSEGRSVVVVDGSSNERAVLSAMARGRVRRVTAVIVTGGGSRAAGIVASLRSIVAVDVVIAVDPGTVRDSRPLTALVVPVGGICLSVDVSEDVISVSDREAPPSRCGRGNGAVATFDADR